MGYMRSHAIIIESYDETLIEAAHQKASAIFSWVSPVSLPQTNGYMSFFVPPDGSKEGWEESDRGDARRAEFKEWLRSKRYSDGSTSLTWAEVQFADDNQECLVLDSSDA